MLAALALLVSATAGLAEKITLKSNDGAMSITGDLIIVNPDNPVLGLTFGQVSRLLAGEITNWAGAVFADPGAIVFVGFANSAGPVEANRKLGQERAESRRAEVQAILDPALLGSVSIDAKGYGEVNPVGCNTDFAGQCLNRRVEIWMR